MVPYRRKAFKKNKPCIYGMMISDLKTEAWDLQDGEAVFIEQL